MALGMHLTVGFGRFGFFAECHTHDGSIQLIAPLDKSRYAQTKVLSFHRARLLPAALRGRASLPLPRNRLSDPVLKRVEFALSSLHFTTWLPIIVTIAIGIATIPFTIPQFDLASRLIISVFVLLSFLGGGTVFFLRSMHFKQDSLWELYTFICFNGKKVDEFPYEKLIDLQEAITNIQRTESLRKKSYDELVKRAKSILS